MNAPLSDLPWDVFADREVSREAAWYARVWDFINRLRSTADPLASYWKARAATSTSVPNATRTVIPLDTIVFDSDAVGIDSHGGYPVPSAGYYFVSAACGFGSFGGQREGCEVQLNGGAVDGGRLLASRLSGIDGVCSGATVVQCFAAGESITVVGYQETFSTVSTLTGTGQRTALTVLRLA